MKPIAHLLRTLALIALPTGLLQAATLQVSNTLDSGSGSLRQAVTDATSGDTITFSAGLSDQTITFTSGQITLNKNLILDASALPAGITLSGNNTSRVFEISLTRVVSFKSMVIRDGYAPSTAYPGNAGGGILNRGTLSLTECTVTANRAILGSDPGGGGIENSGGTLNVTRCAISGNSSTYGGGIESFPGTLTVIQSTLTGNTSTGGGGGIYSGGNAVVNQCTISANAGGSSSFASGGGINNDGGSLTLINSIVALNTATTGANIRGTFTNTGTNLTSGDPLLSPLGNYGGLTLTMPPLPGSPAIDAATSSTFTSDQRGFTFLNAADIGAAEYVGDPVIYNLINLWNQDSDGDGLSYGIEYALGTNPAVSDRNHSRNLTRPVINSSGHAVLSFGLNSSAVSATQWILQRSSSLSPGSFTDIYRYNGSTDFAASGITFVRTASGVTVTDTARPPGKGFYRFRARIEQ